MAKESSDLVTPDLFQSERRPGRPRTNPLPREVQVRVNKRRQLQRDRKNGLRRVELKLDETMYETLNRQAEEQGISRSALIEQILQQALADK